MLSFSNEVDLFNFFAVHITYIFSNSRDSRLDLATGKPLEDVHE